MAFLGKYMKKYVFSGENTRKALLLVNQWNKREKETLEVAGHCRGFHLLCIYGNSSVCLGRRRRRTGSQSHNRKLINTKIFCLK